MTSRAPLCILSCDDATDLATPVAEALGVPITPSRDVWFACGEGKHTVEANVRGTDAYVFQRAVAPDGTRSVYDRFTMLLHAVDACRHADADRVTVVLPYLPGARQDKRKGRTREGVSTGLFARMLEAAGVSMVLTVEPHTEALVGCYEPRNCVLEPIQLTHGLAHFLADEGLVGDVVASTDVGGLESARRFAQLLERGIVALSKERDYSRPNSVASTTVIGDVRDRDVLIVEDIVDTGGSVVSAVDALWDAGAKDVTVAAAHLLMSDPAWERIHALHDRGAASGRALTLVGTSSVVHPKTPSWYRSFDLVPLLARVIRRVNTRGSVSLAVEE